MIRKTTVLRWVVYLRQKMQSVRENVPNDQLKNSLLQAIPFWTASFLTGLVAVLYARLFLWAEKSVIAVLHYRSWLLFILTPACFLFAWWLVRRFAVYAKGSGIPQVMASIDLANPRMYRFVNHLLSIEIVIVKVLSSIVMVLGGGVVGREGPTIQIAGSIFKHINDMLPEWWPKVSKRNVIIAGAASGLSAAFNTPLGGIVFAIEELSKTHINYYKSALITAVIIAGLTAQGLAGPYLYLGYPNLQGLSTWVFAAVLLVALLSGLSGAYVSRLLLYLLRKTASIRDSKNQMFYVLACGLFIAACGFLFGEEALGSGKEIITHALFTDEKYMSWHTPFVRTAGILVSFSTGAAGGIFAPSLSIGASIGSVVAGLFQFSDSNTNLMILSGMVAFLTGVTRSPFTSSILVLEMTDRHNVIFYLMVAGLAGNLIATFVDKHSIYEHLKTQYEDQMMQKRAAEKKRKDKKSDKPA